MITVPRRLAIVLIGLMATACALTNTQHPSTAAIIGDRRVPTSDVERNVDSITQSDPFQQQAQADASGELLQQVQSQVVTALVRSQILAEVAERNGVTVTDADVQAAADDIVEQVGGQQEFERRLAEQGVPQGLFLQQVRDQQLQTALQQQIGADADLTTFVQEALSGVPIDVNPRYGTWDTASLEVTDADPLAPERAGPSEAASGPAAP